MKKLAVGVVGVGYLGRFHAQKYAAMEDVTLVGVVDANPARAREVADELGVSAFGRYSDLFGKVDAVSVVVPTQDHFAVGMAFLEQGVDVLIEKPFTVTIEEADRLIDYADTQGRIIQVGHLERFNPSVLALEDMVTLPRFIESRRLSMFRPRGIDVSVVLDLMIHDIDIILHLVKSPVKEIRAAGMPIITDKVDIANAHLVFENGCTADITASRVSAENERRIRIFQDSAHIAMDFATHEIAVIRKSDSEADSTAPGMTISRVSTEHGDALKDEITAFVHSVAQRIAPKVTGRVGRNALEIALAVMDRIQHSGSAGRCP